MPVTGSAKVYFICYRSAANASWTDGPDDEAGDMKSFDDALLRAGKMVDSGAYSGVHIFRIGHDEPVWSWTAEAVRRP